eukprot:Sdes_comp10304_c0_seq1m1937
MSAPMSKTWRLQVRVNQDSKFLVLAPSYRTVEWLRSEICRVFHALYPQRPSIASITSLKDFNLCDLENGYRVQDVFEDRSDVFVECEYNQANQTQHHEDSLSHTLTGSLQSTPFVEPEKSLDLHCENVSAKNEISMVEIGVDTSFDSESKSPEKKPRKKRKKQQDIQSSVLETVVAPSSEIPIPNNPKAHDETPLDPLPLPNDALPQSMPSIPPSMPEEIVQHLTPKKSQKTSSA